MNGRGRDWLRRYIKLGYMLAAQYDNSLLSRVSNLTHVDLRPLLIHQLELKPLRCSRNGGLGCRVPENKAFVLY